MESAFALVWIGCSFCVEYAFNTRIAPPNTHWSYANLNSEGLGLVVTHATRTTLAQYEAQTISTHWGGLLLSHPQLGSLSSERSFTSVVGSVTSHGSPCATSDPGAPCCSCNSATILR